MSLSFVLVKQTLLKLYKMAHYKKSKLLHLLTENCFNLFGNQKSHKGKREIVTKDNMKIGFKIINILNFIVSLKCSWMKRLTQCHKPRMDIFNAINGYDFKKTLLILVAS